MSDVTIYHNARCSNSRGALALLRERGIEPRVVDYLQQPLTRDALQALVAAMGCPVREVMRSKEPEYLSLGLGDAARTDAELLDALAQHPVLLNRPIVTTAKGTLLCRPPERVLELL
jgi:arsenate reductase